MSENNIHRTWAEDELDVALAEFNADVGTDERVIGRARTALLTSAGQGRAADRRAGAVPPGAVLPHEAPARARRSAGWPGRRSAGWSGQWSARRPAGWSGRRLVVGAAAVGVLVAGALVAQTVPFGGSAPASAEAVAALDRAAAGAIGAVDEPVGPGRYRYVATRAWWMASASVDGREFARLAENLLETWVPADPAGEWLLRRDVTGNQRWVLGTEEEARAAGVPTGNTWPRGGWPEGDERARCGDFDVEPERQCRVPGSWSHPTAEWQAGLPTDPDALLERLEDDIPDGRRHDQLLVYVADALRSGLVGKDVRAALYRAMTGVPGLEVTDRQANVDGRIGTALGLDDGHVRQEIIIDPATGRFIGERRTATSDADGYPPGTVLSFTSVETGVVDATGVRPAG
ncbi:CU044_5270 family protein [Saccharothrix sp. BKS2]|uniref:CU044_5270 family protein n=1 Tax=Saccharothrix sp. BKS2 TaxID=3064400 RepID=UPI0039E9D583